MSPSPLHGRDRVRDWMSTKVLTANLRDGLRQTWDRMAEVEVRHVPVIDDQEQLVGVISDRDLRRPSSLDLGGQADAFRLDNTLKVEQVMSAPPAHVSPDTPLEEALAIIGAHRYGALPVVDDELRVVGILSAWDLLRAFRACLG